MKFYYKNLTLDNISQTSHMHLLGFHLPAFMRIFDLLIKMPKWRHKKIRKNTKMSQKSFYTYERGKSWRINKGYMRISTMETDLVNKWWNFEIMWLKRHSGRRKHKVCVDWWGNFYISWLSCIFTRLPPFLFEFVYLHLLITSSRCSVFFCCGKWHLTGKCCATYCLFQWTYS